MHYTELVFRKGDINRPRATIFIKLKILNMLNLSIFEIKKIKNKTCLFSKAS
jgi:hypothetical protein